MESPLTEHHTASWFPSPCGVLVLKYTHENLYDACVRGFRPLAGFWFLNATQEDTHAVLVEFPSPCGVLVLKFTRRYTASGRRICFRPLAGFWFLNLWEGLSPSPSSRFRPLAGFWFLNAERNSEAAKTEKPFPSPCGVLVLKLLISVCKVYMKAFPSPCGVLVLKEEHHEET